MTSLAVHAVAVLASVQAAQGSGGAELLLVQQQLVALQQVFDARLAGLEGQVEELRTALAEAERGGEPLAAPFLASPPPSSDAVGVARVPVFAPRLAVDSPARYDLVFLKVFRLEAEGRRLVGQLELGQDPAGVALPLDRSGSLYLVEWSTSEGYTYDLQLRDGLSGLVAASVRVKPLESSGRFLLVGYAGE